MEEEDFQNQQYSVNQTLQIDGIEINTMQNVSIQSKIKKVINQSGYNIYVFYDNSNWNTNPMITSISSRWQNKHNREITQNEQQFSKLFMRTKKSPIYIQNVQLVDDDNEQQDNNYYSKYMKYKLKYLELKKNQQ